MTIPNIVQLFHTLKDIGPRRILRRIRYDIRIRFDRIIPPWLASLLSGIYSPAPGWLPVMLDLQSDISYLPNSSCPTYIFFCFLRQGKYLSWPIVWNDPTWSRLWQFHLHYFDWARELLETALITGRWHSQARILEPLIDHWIYANIPGRGDGWHSYTLSLRTRNWIWLFRSFPKLATPLRLQSLWHQLLWLQAHPEHCHGGNHWLENLIALALGGLQFEGSQAYALHNRAMCLLQNELESQVLADGGHEERSASYHLLLLDRLVELACSLESVKSQRPIWLVNSIQQMVNWARAIRLQGGDTPRFNDSAVGVAPPIDDVIIFADGYLHQRPVGSGLRRSLLEAISQSNDFPKAIFSTSFPSQPIVTDLPSTGWTLLRPGFGWELAFKCGVPCPPHLPPHVHSDQLSFELSHLGRWVLSEAGTSIYGNSPERVFERSGAAHNVLQLGLALPSGQIHWIEPVEVWGGFRAARKAQPVNRKSGISRDSSCFASGSHNGFDRIGASHSRRVDLSNVTSDHIVLTVVDTVSTYRPLYFRQWWHLAPSISKICLDSLAFEAPSVEGILTSWHTTGFAEGFGMRTPRQSFCITGCIPTGVHNLEATLPLSTTSLFLP